MEQTRFASLSSEELQNILEDRDSANTKQCIELAKSTFFQYCGVKDVSVESLVDKSKDELCELLINYYAEVRRQDGKMYSRSSMVSLRFGLQRYLMFLRKFDIINDPDFRLPNEMFKAVLIQLKRSGKGTVQHKEVICDSDLQKLFSTNVLNLNDASGLQNKVFIDVMFYTCRRGRENLRKMKVLDFVLKTDGQGRRYFQNVAKYETKNRRGNDIADDDAATARIYEIPGDPKCPVSSLEKYIAKLNPNNDAFWQRPKKTVKDTDSVWYDNSPVGHNTLGNFMKTISIKAGLSYIYTNHCIRATCISSLDQSGVEARHIMSISGHKSETSIKSYSRVVSESKKHEMCSVLQSVLKPESSSTNIQSTESTDANIVNLNNVVFEPVDSDKFISDVVSGYNFHGEKENVSNNIVNQEVQFVTGKQLAQQNQCGPVFHGIGQVHIHYHVKQ